MDSTFFPPVIETISKADDEPESDKEEEHKTEVTSEILSQLPDAPTNEPVDMDDTEEPSQKKQKIDDTSDDDFVVIDKEEMNETRLKTEL